ncbi:uncharacterized protein [Arachis hypogaea]|uniref:uncharacterized protein n=1 Tax=Arachis hypogaea TaxID=3818 RepID=UPI000DEC6D96|nr:uncharacterized protein LOC112801013 [Arachis hypogaea]
MAQPLSLNPAATIASSIATVGVVVLSFWAPETVLWPLEPWFEPLPFCMVVAPWLWVMFQLLRVAIEAAAAAGQEEKGVFDAFYSFRVSTIKETDDEAYEEFYCVLFIRCYCFSY